MLHAAGGGEGGHVAARAGPPSALYMDAAGWAAVAAHRERYLASGGIEGHVVDGKTALLLTTTGRRSGRPRTTPLHYGVDGDRYLVVASLRGDPRHPQWYLNLVAEPRVTVQVGPRRFPAIARTAGDEEKPRLWAIANAVNGHYDDYQARTERIIPLVVLEPAGPDEPGAP